MTSTLADQKPGHYVFVASDTYEDNGRRVPAHETVERRLKELRWPIYSSTRHKTHLRPGDHVAVYLAGMGANRQCFVAKAVIKNITSATRAQKYSELIGAEVELIVELEQVSAIEPAKPILSISKELSFFPIGNPRWGPILMGGCRRISNEDYGVIVK
ncbi:MAG: hypothetical protein V7672_01100 [Brevundimonas sp.]|uniref:hypothetical protein n=1 Tax=Brevundimonas sp. TaxID=1871086 RepID=UPI0030027621